MSCWPMNPWSTCGSCGPPNPQQVPEVCPATSLLSSIVQDKNNVIFMTSFLRCTSLLKNQSNKIAVYMSWLKWCYAGFVGGRRHASFKHQMINGCFSCVGRCCFFSVCRSQDWQHIYVPVLLGEWLERGLFESLQCLAPFRGAPEWKNAGLIQVFACYLHCKTNTRSGEWPKEKGFAVTHTDTTHPPPFGVAVLRKKQQIQSQIFHVTCD